MGFRFGSMCNPCCVCADNTSNQKWKVSDCCYGWTSDLSNTYMRLFASWGLFPHNDACPENFGYTLNGDGTYTSKPGCILSYLGFSDPYYQWRGEIPDGRYCIIETSERYFESAVGWNCYARTLENLYIYNADGSLEWSYIWSADRTQYEASYLCSTCGSINLSADCALQTGNIFCDVYPDCPGLTRDNYSGNTLTVTTAGFTSYSCDVPVVGFPGVFCHFHADTSDLNGSWACHYRQGMPYIDYLAGGSVGSYDGMQFMSDVKYAQLTYDCGIGYPCQLPYRMFVYIKDVCNRFGTNTANVYNVYIQLFAGTLFGDEGNTCINTYQCGIALTNWCVAWSKVDINSGWVVGVPGTAGYGNPCDISVTLSG